MVNYQNGKIYKIVSNQTENIYIGSTTKQYLSQRIGQHLADYKRYLQKKFRYISSFEIVKYDDAKIILIQNFACASKDELRAKEQEIISQYGNLCVNKYNAKGRDEEKEKNYIRPNLEERREYVRQYRIKNEQQLKEKIICECGVSINKYGIKKHNKTKKHQQWEKSNICD